MFCLNVAIGNIAWRLLFKTEQGALSAVALCSDGLVVKIVDDFGHSFEAKVSSIHGTLLEDLDKTKMAHCELFLHQKRTEAAAVKMAQADPGLRAMAGQSPAIINPMGGNGARPF